MHLQITAASHVGRRPSNQDAFAIEEAIGLAVVADGMGGHPGGEVAAALAVAAVHDTIAALASDDNPTWPWPLDPTASVGANELAIATAQAQRALEARRHGRLAEMGTTIAMIHLLGRQVHVAHVGDSRVYLLRDGALHALTHDHSVLGELQRAGVDLASRADHPWGNAITRALGPPTCAPDLRDVAARVGDVFVLCTDGLWEPVAPATLGALAQGPSADAACDALIHEALRQGGRDNITVVLARVAAGPRRPGHASPSASSPAPSSPKSP
jgi:serine/threonine protein phosphatase PrpC